MPALLGIFFVSGAADLRAMAGDGPLITDDRPRTEYYRLRRRLGLDRSPPGWRGVVLGALGRPE